MFAVLLLALILLFSPANVDCGVEFQIGSKGKQANMDRFDGTCGRNDMKMSMLVDGIDFDGVNLYLNYTFIVKENIRDEALKNTITIKRCLSKENPDSCENFYVYTVRDYCKLLSQTSNALWSSFYTCIHPQPKCPLIKGIYRGVDCKLAVAAFLMFPVAGYYWKTKIEITREMDRKLLYCSFAETQISVKRF